MAHRIGQAFSTYVLRLMSEYEYRVVFDDDQQTTITFQRPEQPVRISEKNGRPSHVERREVSSWEKHDEGA